MGLRWDGDRQPRGVVMLVCVATDGTHERRWCYASGRATREAAFSWAALTNAARDAFDGPTDGLPGARERYTVIEYPGSWDGEPAPMSDAAARVWLRGRHPGLGDEGA